MRATFNLLGHIDITTKDFEKDPQLREKIDAEHEKLTKLYSENDHKYAKFWSVGVDSINDLTSLGHELPLTTWDAHYTALEGSLLGTWSAFEALAGDLLIAAINESPLILGELRGSATRLTTGTKAYDDEDDDDEDSDKDNDKKVSLRELVQALKQGEIMKSMGHLLRRKLKFTSLLNIRRAYSIAFPDECKWIRPTKIDEALKSDCLDAVSILRNVIVHNAGIPNAKTIAQARTCSIKDRLKEGSPIQLTFPDVVGLITPVAEAVRKLIEGVDKWLVDSASVYAKAEEAIPTAKDHSAGI